MAAWREIQLAALKKIDPAITSLTRTRNTKDYLNAMVPVANRGLQDLATAGKYITKSYEISIPAMVNVVLAKKELYQHVNEDIELIADCGKAFYFEVSGKGAVDIYVGDDVVKSLESKGNMGFEIFKGKISNEEKNLSKSHLRGYIHICSEIYLFMMLILKQIKMFGNIRQIEGFI